MSARRSDFFGVPLDALDMAGTVQAIEAALDAARPIAHLGLNAANLIAARDSQAYRDDLAAADIVTADGQSVVWGARLYGIDVPERVSGIDLMAALLERARARGWGVYLLGARPDVVGELARRLRADGVHIIGHRDGYFTDEDGSAVADVVAASGASLLFVGTPSPHKERFIIHAARPAGIGVSIGVGGSFDVLAGRVARAPRIMQRLGLEWLFRLVQEPRRLFARYAVTNSRYLWLLASGAVRRRPRSRADR